MFPLGCRNIRIFNVSAVALRFALNPSALHLLQAVQLIILENMDDEYFEINLDFVSNCCFRFLFTNKFESIQTKRADPEKRLRPMITHAAENST